MKQKEEKKCCEDYNGDVDVTNSCIFCKKYLGSTKKPEWEIGLGQLASKAWKDGLWHSESELLISLKSFIKDLLSRQRDEMIPEIVICAAVRMEDDYIIRGHRHSDCIRTAEQIPRYKESGRPFGGNQGFVTSKNRYVDRIEGAKIQKAAGIQSKMPEGQEYLHGELYSEDLY